MGSHLSSYSYLALLYKLTFGTLLNGLRRNGQHKILSYHKERPGDSTIASSSEFVVLLEVHVEVLLKVLVPDEPQSADRALELDSFVDLSNGDHVKSKGC